MSDELNLDEIEDAMLAGFFTIEPESLRKLIALARRGLPDKDVPWSWPDAWSYEFDRAERLEKALREIVAIYESDNTTLFRLAEMRALAHEALEEKP